MSKEVKEVKKKIEMLTNHLVDSIDVDLLSDSQKIAYLKAIQPFVMPKLQDVKQQTSLDVSENLEWLIDSDPFGLFATYIDGIGVRYEYTNGKIESVHYNGKSVDYT